MFGRYSLSDSFSDGRDLSKSQSRGRNFLKIKTKLNGLPVKSFFPEIVKLKYSKTLRLAPTFDFSFVYIGHCS